MRRMGKGLAALTLASAGVALSVMGTAGPASAGGDLVDIKVGNVTVYNEISPSVAANLCDINVVNVERLRKGDKTECKALSTSVTKAFVVND